MLSTKNGILFSARKCKAPEGPIQPQCGSDDGSIVRDSPRTRHHTRRARPGDGGRALFMVTLATQQRVLGPGHPSTQRTATKVAMFAPRQLACDVYSFFRSAQFGFLSSSIAFRVLFSFTDNSTSPLQGRLFCNVTKANLYLMYSCIARTYLW